MLMPRVKVNGINLSYDDYGSGDPVLLITGSGATGRMWTPHQVPALIAAGFRVITVDNRGMPPSDLCPEGFTIDDMVADTVGLIKFLDIGPCRIVGFSLGAMMVQELLLAYPDLITQAVLSATRGRSDAMHTAMSVAESELAESGIVLPPRYAAVVHAMQFLSPTTQNDEGRIKDWLDIFEMSLVTPSVNRSQHGLELVDNRLEEYRKIRSECLVIGFQDDLIAPPNFCREVADSIPGCRYEELVGCGHYGYLEQPEKINSLIINFFAAGETEGMR
jgi:pimeloyl-ACP methyl ester carboxylesterase